MGPRDTRQINWRATPPTADLLDLAILVRQTVDADPTFTIKKAAEEATRTWALEQLRAYPDIATRSAVGLTIGAGPATRDLELLTQYLRDNGLNVVADHLEALTDPASGYSAPGVAPAPPVVPDPVAPVRGASRTASS